MVAAAKNGKPPTWARNVVRLDYDPFEETSHVTALHHELVRYWRAGMREARGHMTFSFGVDKSRICGHATHNGICMLPTGVGWWAPPQVPVVYCTRHRSGPGRLTPPRGDAGDGLYMCRNESGSCWYGPGRNAGRNGAPI